MDEKDINEIFEYNKFWLTGQKRITQSIYEKLEDEFFKADMEYKTIEQLKKRKKQKEKVPNYLKGSLISLDKSIALKESLQFQFFGYNILSDVLKLADYCVPTDFYRYQKCNDEKIYRSLLSFITTKDNADKLVYLNKQPISYEYLAIDYTTVEYTKRTEIGNVRDRRPEENRYKVKSKNFNTMLGYNESTDKYQIPTYIDFTNYVRKRKNNISELQEEINTLKKNPTKSNMEKVAQLNKKIGLSRSTTLNGLVKNAYTLESDNYYREMLENFKKQVKKKTGISIPLSQWSVCIVFTSQWCDSSYEPDAEAIEGINIVQGIVRTEKTEKEFINKYSKLLFNRSIQTNSIDPNLIYFVMETLKQKKVDKPELPLEPELLDSYELIYRTFQKFPDGGHWIKKLEKDGKKYVQKVIGPYSLQDARRQAKVENNILPLEKGKSAISLSFDELVCNDDITKSERELNSIDYLKIKDIYKLPPGIQLFCLVNRTKEIAYFEKKYLDTRFRDFSQYAFDHGMKFLATLQYLIYYNPDSKSSIRKASEMKYLLVHRQEYSDSEFIYLEDSIMGRKTKRGKKPKLIPFQISEELIGKDKIDYDILKGFYDKISNMECGPDRLNLSFENFQSTFGKNFTQVYRNEDFEIKTEINMEIVTDPSDIKGKKVKLIKNYDTSYELTMKRRRRKLMDIDLISVSDIRDCTGYLNVNFTNKKDKSWDISKLELFSEDVRFNNETVLIVFMMYLAKCFGVRLLMLDNRPTKSDCDNSVFYHYYHIYYLAYQSFKKFEELGFVVNNEEGYMNFVNSIKDISLADFLVKNQIEMKIDTDYSNTQLSVFCKNFLESKKCSRKDDLLMIKKISEFVENKIKLEIFNDLNERDFFSMEQYIMGF